MRSVLAGLRRLVIPWGAANSQPRIAIATDDPLSKGINDAAISYYWDANRGFVTGVEKSGTGPTALGQWRLYGVAPSAEVAGISGLSQLISVEYDPTDPEGDGVFLRGGSRIARTGRIAVQGSVAEIGSSSQLEKSATDARVYGMSMSRGLAVRGVVNSGLVANITTADSVVFTLPTFTYTRGRAYQFEIRSRVQVSATTDIQPRLFKTDLSGPMLVDCGSMVVDGSAVIRPFFWSGNFIVSGAGDISAAIAFACRTSAGTGAFSGTSTNPFEFRVTDIGATANFLSLPVLF